MRTRRRTRVGRRNKINRSYNRRRRTKKKRVSRKKYILVGGPRRRPAPAAFPIKCEEDAPKECIVWPENRYGVSNGEEGCWRTEEFPDDLKESVWSPSLMLKGLELVSVKEEGGNNAWCYVEGAQKTKIKCPKCNTMDEVTMRNYVRDWDYTKSQRDLGILFTEKYNYILQVALDGCTNEELHTRFSGVVEDIQTFNREIERMGEVEDILRQLVKPEQTCSLADMIRSGSLNHCDLMVFDENLGKLVMEIIETDDNMDSDFEVERKQTQTKVWEAKGKTDELTELTKKQETRKKKEQSKNTEIMLSSIFKKLEHMDKFPHLRAKAVPHSFFKLMEVIKTQLQSLVDLRQAAIDAGINEPQALFVEQKKKKKIIELIIEGNIFLGHPHIPGLCLSFNDILIYYIVEVVKTSEDYLEFNKKTEEYIETHIMREHKPGEETRLALGKPYLGPIMRLERMKKVCRGYHDTLARKPSMLSGVAANICQKLHEYANREITGMRFVKLPDEAGVKRSPEDKQYYKDHGVWPADQATEVATTMEKTPAHELKAQILVHIEEMKSAFTEARLIIELIDDINKFFQHYDINEDGHIDKEEFVIVHLGLLPVK